MIEDESYADRSLVGGARENERRDEKTAEKRRISKVSKVANAVDRRNESNAARFSSEQIKAFAARLQ